MLNLWVENNRKDNMAKNVLVIFDMQIGNYEHSDQYIFDKIKSK